MIKLVSFFMWYKICFYKINAINAAATIAGPNGIYVLFSGCSLSPLNINTQDIMPNSISIIARMIYKIALSTVIILKYCNA